jgi:hypothetical protein
MSLHEMAKEWNVPFSKVHAAACEYKGGKLPKGRAYWTDADKDAIKRLIEKEMFGDS